MKYAFLFTLVALVIVALTGNRQTRRQHVALAALAFIGALAAFGTYTTTWIRGYKAEPFQVAGIQLCLFLLGIFSLRIAMRKKK